MKKRNIMDFAGSWKNVSDEEADKIKDDIKILKKKANKDLLNKIKNNKY